MQVIYSTRIPVRIPASQQNAQTPHGYSQTLLLSDPSVRDTSQQTGTCPQARPAKRAHDLGALDRSEDADEGVDERAQDQYGGTLGQDLSASSEAVWAETKVVGERLGEVGVLSVELGWCSNCVKSTEQLVRGRDSRYEEEASGGQASGCGEQDLQQQIVLATMVESAQVVKVGDHVDGQPGEGGCVEGDGVDSSAEDGHKSQHLPIAHNGARGGPGQPGVGG